MKLWSESAKRRSKTHKQKQSCLSFKVVWVAHVFLAAAPCPQIPCDLPLGVLTWHAMRFQTKLHFALLQFTWLQLRSSCAIQSRIAIAAIAIEQLLNSLNSYSALCVFALQNRKTLWRFKSLTVHCITQELSHQLSERTLSLNSWTPHVYSSVFWVDSVVHEISVNDFFSVRFCKTVKGQVFWENELDLPRCSEHSLNSLVCTEWQGDCAAHAAHAKVLQPDPCRQSECFVSLSAKFNTKSSCQLFHFPAADFAILCNPTTYWLVWPRLTLQPTAALNSKAFLWKLLSVTSTDLPWAIPRTCMVCLSLCLIGIEPMHCPTLYHHHFCRHSISLSFRLPVSLFCHSDYWHV